MTVVITSLAVVGLFVFLRFTFMQTWGYKERLLLFLLIVYLPTVLLITLGFRTYDNEIEMNLKPFSTYKMMFQRTIDNMKIGNYSKAWQEFLWIGYVSWSCVILNILLFVPLGYLLPLSIKKTDKWYLILAIGIVFSAIIETTQLISHRGWFDVDDIIHNGVGTIIGWLWYRRWLCPTNDIKNSERDCHDNS